MNLEHKTQDYFAKDRKIIPRGLYSACRVCGQNEIHEKLGQQEDSEYELYLYNCARCGNTKAYERKKEQHNGR